MKKTTLLINIAMLLLLIACNVKQDIKEEVDNESLLYATLYQQKSAEVEALCYQAYNIAELRLNQILENNPYKKPLAIVVDVDETVLDNSPFEAKCILENKDYPNFWVEWCEVANARALPGAVEFLNYAKSKGVEIFYITNRKIEVQKATMKNLKVKGFPYVDDAHMMLRTTESNKQPRRNKVMETHEIVILMGDNLNDFTDLFDKKLPADRSKIVSDLKAEFGKKFIVLPNAMYGDWVSAMLNYENLSKAEKLKKLNQMLKAF